MVIIGVPLNVYSLHRNLSAAGQPKLVNDSMRILKINLAITDLMMLLFFGLSKVIWWSTFQWLGGDFLCKLVQFLLCLALYSSSNFVALVGVVRWLAVRHLIDTVSFCPKHYKLYICAAYCSAFCTSFPQFFVWKVIHPYPLHPKWAQCITMWAAARWMGEDTTYGASENAYHLAHMLFVFWIPLVIVLISYLGAVVEFRRNIHCLDKNFINLQNQCESTVVNLQFEIENPQQNIRPNNISSRTLVRAKDTLIRKTAYILLAYVLCWSSYNILTLLDHLNVIRTNSLWRQLYYLIVLNAVVNPFIYGF